MDVLRTFIFRIGGTSLLVLFIFDLAFAGGTQQMVPGLHNYDIQEIKVGPASLPGGYRLLSHSDQGPETLRVNISLDGTDYTLRLEPHPMRAADFGLFVHGRDGSIRQVDPPPSATYRGLVEQCPGSRVAASVIDQSLAATIQLDSGVHWYVEPLSNFLSEVDPSPMHVVYASRDVAPSDHICGFPEPQGDYGMAQIASKSSGSSDVNACDYMKVCEIACDVESEFYAAKGSSVEETLLDIEQIMNHVSEIYEREVGVAYAITAVFVRETDELYTIGKPDELLTELVNQWDNHHPEIRRAVVHLFTGKVLEVHLGGQTLDILGSAHRHGTICGSYAYAVSSGPTLPLRTRVNITAHEIGHNWGVSHSPDDPDRWLMRPAMNIRGGLEYVLSASAIQRIRSTIDSITCLPDYAAYYDIPYHAGKGTEIDPYAIRCPRHLQSIGSHPEDWDKHFRLTADIDLSGLVFDESNIIGNATIPFTGVFDGRGHIISRFRHVSQTPGEAGLFGVVDGQAQIKNLSIREPAVTAEQAEYVGPLVALMMSGTVSRCSVDGGYVSGRAGVGGLIGCNMGRLEQCYSSARISGAEDVGGLAGANKGLISNCYAVGLVMGNRAAAGLVGRCYDIGTISSCYAGGYVLPAANAGGLVGYADHGAEILDSFWNIETTGQSISAGGIGKTDEQMSRRITFESTDWDFTNVWMMLSTIVSSPRLRLKGYEGGTGRPKDPYLIATANQLNAVGSHPEDWDKHFKLIRDIDLSDYTGENFNMIGHSYSNSFRGVFDGNDHSIWNFSYESSSPYNRRDQGPVGLFGYAAGNARIRGISLKTVVIKADQAYTIGPLVGMLASGRITDCRTQGARVSGSDYIGGLVGCTKGWLEYSYAQADISGEKRVGGLVGHSAGIIFSCYTAGNVSGDKHVGGLAGWTWDSITADCYSRSSVSGQTNVGGLIGRLAGTVIDSYATGRLAGERETGGLIGNQYQGEVIRSFWDIETTGQTSGDGGDSKTTAELTAQATFDGWDFDRPLWRICDGTNYPKLAWQTPAPGDVSCPDGVAFEDLSSLTAHWLYHDCQSNPELACERTDIDRSGTVDLRDFAVLAGYWLQGTEP